MSPTVSAVLSTSAGTNPHRVQPNQSFTVTHHHGTALSPSEEDSTTKHHSSSSYYTKLQQRVAKGSTSDSSGTSTANSSSSVPLKTDSNRRGTGGDTGHHSERLDFNVDEQEWAMQLRRAAYTLHRGPPLEEAITPKRGSLQRSRSNPEKDNFVDATTSDQLFSELDLSSAGSGGAEQERYSTVLDTSAEDRQIMMQARQNANQLRRTVVDNSNTKQKNRNANVSAKSNTHPDNQDFTGDSISSNSTHFRPIDTSSQQNHRDRTYSADTLNSSREERELMMQSRRAANNLRRNNAMTSSSEIDSTSDQLFRKLESPPPLVHPQDISTQERDTDIMTQLGRQLATNHSVHHNAMKSNIAPGRNENPTVTHTSKESTSIGITPLSAPDTSFLPKKGPIIASSFRSLLSNMNCADNAANLSVDSGTTIESPTYKSSCGDFTQNWKRGLQDLKKSDKVMDTIQRPNGYRGDVAIAAASTAVSSAAEDFIDICSTAMDCRAAMPPSGAKNSSKRGGLDTDRTLTRKDQRTVSSASTSNRTNLSSPIQLSTMDSRISSIAISKASDESSFSFITKSSGGSKQQLLDQSPSNSNGIKHTATPYLPYMPLTQTPSSDETERKEIEPKKTRSDDFTHHHRRTNNHRNMLDDAFETETLPSHAKKLQTVEKKNSPKSMESKNPSSDNPSIAPVTAASESNSSSRPMKSIDIVSCHKLDLLPLTTEGQVESKTRNTHFGDNMDWEAEWIKCQLQIKRMLAQEVVEWFRTEADIGDLTIQIQELQNNETSSQEEIQRLNNLIKSNLELSSNESDCSLPVDKRKDTKKDELYKENLMLKAQIRKLKSEAGKNTKQLGTSTDENANPLDSATSSANNENTTMSEKLTLRAELIDLKAQVTEYKAKIIHLEGILEKEKSWHGRAKKQLEQGVSKEMKADELLKEVDSLRLGLKTKTDTLAESTAYIKSLEKTVDELVQTWQTEELVMQDEISKLKACLETERLKFEALNSSTKNNEWQLKVAQLEKELAEERERIDSILKAGGDLSSHTHARLLAYRKKYDHSLFIEKQLQENISCLEQKLKTALEDLQKSRMTEQRNDADVVPHENTSTQWRESSNLCKEIEELQAELSSVRQERDSVKQEIQQLREKESKHNEFEVLCIDLKARLIETEGQLVSVRTTETSLRALITTLENQLKDQRKEALDAKIRSDELALALDETDELMKKAAFSADEKQRLKTEINQLTSELMDSRTKARRFAVKVESENRKMKETEEQLNQELSEMRQRIEDSAIQLQEEQEAHRNVVEQLRKSKDELVQCNVQITLLEQQVRLLNAELDNYKDSNELQRAKDEISQCKNQIGILEEQVRRLNTKIENHRDSDSSLLNEIADITQKRSLDLEKHEQTESELTWMLKAAQSYAKQVEDDYHAFKCQAEQEIAMLKEIAASSPSMFQERTKVEDSTFEERTKVEDSTFQERTKVEDSTFRERTKVEDSTFQERTKVEDVREMDDDTGDVEILLIPSTEESKS